MWGKELNWVRGEGESYVRVCAGHHEPRLGIAWQPSWSTVHWIAIPTILQYGRQKIYANSKTDDI